MDALGVSEPLIQEYGLGADQILVELPGVSDLDQVKTIIKSTARLEIHAVDGGPFPSADAALQSVNGALPPNDEILPFSGDLAASNGPEYYLIDRTSIVAGSDFRSAQPGVNSNTGQRMVTFTLTDEAGDKFWSYTSANIGKYMAVIMGGSVRSVAVIKGAIRDQGQIEGSFIAERGNGTFQAVAHGRAARLPQLHFGQHRGRNARRRLHPRGRYRRDRRRSSGHGLHADLLQGIGHQRRFGVDLQPGHPAGHHGSF